MSRAPVDPITELTRVLARTNKAIAEVRRIARRQLADGRLRLRAENEKAPAATGATRGEK